MDSKVDFKLSIFNARKLLPSRIVSTQRELFAIRFEFANEETLLSKTTKKEKIKDTNLNM